MDIREWRRLAARCVGMLALVLLISVLCFIQRYGNFEHTVHAQDQEENIPGDLPEQTAERQEAKTSKEKEAKSVSDTYIKISKPDYGQALDAYLENDYMDFSIVLTLEGIDPKQYNAADIKRVYRAESYSGAYQENQDMVKEIKIVPLKQQDVSSVRIRMQMTDIYEPTLFETPEAYYISLEKPQDVYDHVVVIDAGHGGYDEGTISLDGKYYEKDYALRIVSDLKELLDKDSDIKAYYTRLSDVNISKAKRVRLANAVHADAFVSVHCNASNPGDTTANGMEALYSSRERTASETLTSRQLSACVLKQLCDVTGRKSRGVIKRDGLYLMNHSKVPVTIIEVGYMSNRSDLRYLLREKNQKQIAEGIYQGIQKSVDK